MRLTIVLACLALSAAARGQNVDLQIQKDLESVLDLAAAPKEASEEQRKAKVEQFKAALVRFVSTWEPKASELRAGRYPLARALLLLGRPEQAIPPLEGFVRDQPKSDDIEEAKLSLAGAFLDTRRYDRAEQAYQEFLASHPSSQKRIVARYYLAITRIESGQIEPGVQELREISKAGVDHPIVGDANLKLVQTLAEAGRVQEARDHLAGLLKDNADAPALLAIKEQLDWIGKPAPEIDGVRTWLNGPGLALADVRGTVVVLTFFAEPYDASRAELAHLRDVAAPYASGPVRFVGLTTYYRKKTRPMDEEDRLLGEFLGKENVPFTVGVVADFRMLHAYGVRGVPQTVVIGPTGSIAYLKVGASRSDRRGVQALKAAIDRAVASIK